MKRMRLAAWLNSSFSVCLFNSISELNVSSPFSEMKPTFASEITKCNCLYFFSQIKVNISLQRLFIIVGHVQWYVANSIVFRLFHSTIDDIPIQAHEESGNSSNQLVSITEESEAIGGSSEPQLGMRNNLVRSSKEILKTHKVPFPGFKKLKDKDKEKDKDKDKDGSGGAAGALLVSSNTISGTTTTAPGKLNSFSCKTRTHRSLSNRFSFQWVLKYSHRRMATYSRMA